MRAWRHRLVYAILFLHHGAKSDGPIRLLQLDAAHVQHHYLRDPVGSGTEGMAGREPAQPRHHDRGSRDFGGRDGRDRVGQLPRGARMSAARRAGWIAGLAAFAVSVTAPAEWAGAARAVEA